jgi:c-di-GMP-binding flagellar brake protein YcgR
MDDQRKAIRDERVMPAVSCFAELADGTQHEGVVTDLSDTGARISGAVAGLADGDEIQLVLVVQQQKIVYRCVVRHVNSSERFYGVEFKSRPKPVQSVHSPRRDHSAFSD